MTIKYKSNLEFYKIFFYSNEKEQPLPYFQVPKEEAWRIFADSLNDNNREKKIRGKKHKMWIDDIDNTYFYGFASRENHNGAMIEKETLEITLAQDENSRQELASLSHFVIDLRDNVLALERFDGSMSKQGFFEYCRTIFKDLGLTMDIRPIPRNDLREVLNDVTRLLSFSAKYNDIARINPDFIEENIKSKDKKIEESIKNPKYQARVRIDFTKEGLEIDRNDIIIKRILKKIFRNKCDEIDQEKEVEEDGWLDGKIEIRTMAGNEEIVALQENLFVTKMDFETEESMNRREFSEKSYKKILEKMQEMRTKNP